MSLSVLYEDNHLLVLDKPSGLATMGTEAHEESMVRQAADYLKHKYNKPGNVFVGVVSRLDRLVSGVLVFARTSKAASRLSDQIRRRTPSKRYLALLEGQIASDFHAANSWNTVQDYVRKDEAAQRMKVVNTTEASAKVERGTKGDSRSEKSSQTRLAELRYRVLASSPSLSCVEVDLITGRKHQIRLQLSNLGHPVLGDRKYGSTRKFSSGIALHCAELTIQHPTKKDQMCFRAATPNSWQQKDGSLLEEALKRWNALKDSVDG